MPLNNSNCEKLNLNRVPMKSLAGPITRSVASLVLFFIMAYQLSAQDVRLLHTLTGHTENVRSVSWNPNGSELASGGFDKTIRIWNPISGENLRSFDGIKKVKAVAWSPDRQAIAHAGYAGTIQVRDSRSGDLRLSLEVEDEQVDFLTWNPDGMLLAAGSLGSLKVFSIKTGKVVFDLGSETEWINSVAWCPNAESLAIGYANGGIKIFSNLGENADASNLGEATGENVLALAYSPDGKILASSNGCFIYLWNMVSGKRVNTLKGHSCELTTYVSGKFAGQDIPVIRSIAFHPNGELLASGGQDRAGMLWDVSSGKAIATLVGHSQDIRVIAFSPNGKVLATASDDTTIKVWSLSEIVVPR